MDKLC